MSPAAKSYVASHWNGYNKQMKSGLGLEGIVNASGFMLQIGLRTAVEQSQSRHRFEVEAMEHPWKTAEQAGFIDLILGRSTVRLVCECKRSRDGNWVFAVERDAPEGDRVRFHWTRFGKNYLFGGWFNFGLSTTSHESQFCMIRGTGENDSPLLERIASKLLASVEALAVEETSLRLVGDTRDSYRIYVPVIITTARLWICRFRAEDIDLATGDVAKTEFEEVPLIRFRKALTPPAQPEPGGDADEMPYRAFRRVSREQERTVIIVNAASFVAQLDGWAEGVIRADSGRPPDWNEP
jgi:hypothetical protein